ncbi:ANKH [Bugula neritina]|uniref:ANKH n=1 Tax=Bugula neritina TaxID=10212 RepID=A0A7J7KH48_BUGNE|nr:ANKH [Bugula neritina]
MATLPRPDLLTCRNLECCLDLCCPLVITNMVPDAAEQVLTRGITSIASDEMTTLLASYGLAYYVTKILINVANEQRHVGIVLVKTWQDQVRMTIFSIVNGVFLSSLFTHYRWHTCLSPLGILLIRDLHGQSEEVATITCRIITYLSPTPFLEAIAYYFEGGLIGHKFTGYAGIAKMTDFAMQTVFTVALLFTSTRTEPVLVPVFSLYAGIIGRLVIVIGFWVILVRRLLPDKKPTEKPLTVASTIWFLIPLVMVRVVQVTSRPIINLVVSRTLSETAGPKAAAQVTVYPAGRVVFSWLNDLRTIPPTFHKVTPQHEKFKIKTLSIYATFCTMSAFTINFLLYIIPGAAYFVMNTLIGLNSELAELSVLPLRIYSIVCLCIGPRAYFTGILIMKKRTMYLTPSALFRFLGLILFLSTLSNTRLSGANLGITSLLLGFVLEAIFVVAAVTFLRYKPKLCSRTKHSVEDDSTGTEAMPLSNTKSQP